MNSPIVVSVICTCFNKGRWIRQALDSIARQKVSFPIEIIIVADASTDESLLEIEAFRNLHPDMVRVFAHDKNKGISATWVETCPEARGLYIARMDGDDYWTDNTKLQQQVDLLSASPDSKWCCTDFDMVDQDGNTICEKALETGFIATVDSFEQMLAIKGLTAPSTWLVDAQLMKEVSAELDPDAEDDTFSLQLDLFKRTRLSRIMSYMCAMRLNAGSDSRPQMVEGATKRYEGLKRQQLKYLEKYADSDLGAIIRYLLDRDVEMEIQAFEYLQQLHALEARMAEQDELIGQLRAQTQGYQNSRNFIRPMKNAAKSVFKRGR